MAEILESQGHDVHIIDNNSTYEPTLKWYNSGQFTVYYLKENLGSTAPWQCEWLDTSDYYVVTDPDLGIENIPSNWPDILIEGIEKHNVIKCGFSLDETFTPSENPAYTLDKFYRYPNGNPAVWDKSLKLDKNYYNCHIDTTFAVYVPGVKKHIIGGIRSERPYTARHLPWHIVNEIKNEQSIQILMDNELEYYYDHCQANSRSITMHRIQPLLQKYKSKFLEV